MKTESAEKKETDVIGLEKLEELVLDRKGNIRKSTTRKLVRAIPLGQPVIMYSPPRDIEEREKPPKNANAYILGESTEASNEYHTIYVTPVQFYKTT